MGWDGAGGYSRQHNFSADASAGIKILASRMDEEINDIASAFTRVWTRDGQNTPTQDLSMGGRKFVNVGAPTSVSNFMRAREFIENIPIFMQDAESSADRISVSSQYFTSVSANQAPVDGTKIMVRVNSNKSSAVLYLDGHSANVEFQDGNRAANAMVSGGIYELTYSSVDTAWKLPTPSDGRTPAEIAAGVTPVSLQYPYGDPRRRGPSVIIDADDVDGWFDHGYTATRVNDTTFTIAGDRTAIYSPQRRVRLIDELGAQTFWRIRSSSYSAPDTTIVGVSDGGNVPTTIASIAIAALLSATGPGVVTWDYTVQDGQWFWNTNDTANAIGRIAVAVGIDGLGADTALAVVVTHSTRASGYITGAPTGASVVIHTGEAVPIVFGVSDTTKLILPVATSAAQFFGSEESLRFVSPRADDIGGSYVTFYEDDNTTRKGRIGFDDGGTTDRMAMVQEESAPMVFSGGTKHTHTNANKAFVFDVLDEYADDAAAAVGGVEVGELYRTASVVKQRVA